jgi:hypothetical protein
MILLLINSEENIFAQPESNDSSENREKAVRIFLDCVNYDLNYIREEIPYVNHVRDIREVPKTAKTNTFCALINKAQQSNFNYSGN